MSRLRIAPVVEGHGEVDAVRTLLSRIWLEIVGGEYLDVLHPIRRPRSKLLRAGSATAAVQPDPDEIGRAVELAAMKLAAKREERTRSLVLLMLDADEDCPKKIVEAITATCTRLDPRIDLSIVFPCVEYETWFVAAASSLTAHLQLREGDDELTNPEGKRLGKSWIKERLAGYSETVDQVRLTAAMDLTLCRERSPSFDKLCRELERRRGDVPT